jgi:3-oxoacyl-[acyl-carrier-protein] synthase-3
MVACYRSVIKGIGHYLPEKIVTNAELATKLDTSDAWIRERTGIAARHIAAEGEFTSDLAAKAAQAALRHANLTADAIDAIIVATTTPDETIPATATRVQQKLGMNRGFAFDMQAACSGFVYGLAVADGLIRSGQITRALVIGAETYSRIVDWNDRSICILFGDGAGAVVLEATEQTEAGILHTALYSDGTFADILKTTGGVSSTQEVGMLQMNGKEVFRHATVKMGEALQQAANAANISIAAIDWVIPHQANARIVSAMAEKFNLPLEKVIMTMDRHANTSAASIPLALAVAQAEGKLKKGNLIAMPALGAGLTWGCCIIRL